MKQLKRGVFVLRTGLALMSAVLIPQLCVADAVDAEGPVVLDSPVQAIVSDAVPTGEGVVVTTGGIAAEETPWGAPVLVSPTSAATLYHYPRATTLAWRPVTDALSYRLERQYQVGTTWVAYPAVVTEGRATSYTFNFVSDTKGRWRVAAYNGWYWSPFSVWRIFSYATKPQMSTPILVSPVNNTTFDHYPRTMTLAWRRVPAAVGYKVEIKYCQPDGVTCSDYAPVTVTNAYYTFNFVGGQPGKWRVTTLGGSTYLDSVPSTWRTFKFSY